MKLSLKTKVLVLIVTIVLTLAVCLTTLLIWKQEASLVQRIEQAQSVVLRVLAFDQQNNTRESGFTYKTNEKGLLTSAEWEAVPDFANDKVAEGSILQTGGIASVLRFDAQKGRFVRVSSTFRDAAGTYATGSELDPESDSHAALLRGEPFHSTVSILGTPVMVEHFPIRNREGTVTGALEAGFVQAELSAVIENALTSAALAAGGLVAVAVLLSLILMTLVLRPVERINTSMKSIAAGDYNTKVPHQDTSDAIGDIARNLDTFREALAVAQSAREAQMAAQMRAAEQAEMTSRIQSRVVREISDGLHRLESGDLSKRIESPANDPFPAEYEQLSASYNAVIDALDTTIHDARSVANPFLEARLKSTMHHRGSRSEPKLKPQRWNKRPQR